MFLDFSNKSTWLNQVNPSFKLLLFVFLFVGLLFIDNIHFYLYFTIGLLIIYFLMTGFPIKWLLIFISPFFIIFLSSFISMALFGEGETLWYRFGMIHITQESFFRGIHLGLRGIIFGFLGLIFALTTKPVMFFYSTMQQYRLKPKLAYSFMAAIRLLPMVAEEVYVLKQALKVRGVIFPKGISGFYQRLKYYSVPILAQSIRRAHRIAIAMEAKQFDGNAKRTYYYQSGYSYHDIWFCLLLLGGIMICFFLQNNFTFLPVERVIN
ncbi:energy-coupling factor transporter transmembrane protein EcfT [Gracilibacillus oryzae]|uniref:Energy-coupling factor transporter transmembrane protein EcfT n=1 Tax=Gracilibacillus oryzae TaxID=1672701 RepID=A0A7C8KS16_9BACI|nr:energy-coupling factor transporter transmembrane component T [Gracilibacillus oryzae]KAB8138531.1 energy-coupling factor transporter transmembrane protein EcfT [Gracilibacillus oryzae]